MQVYVRQRFSVVCFLGLVQGMPWYTVFMFGSPKNTVEQNQNNTELPASKLELYEGDLENMPINWEEVWGWYAEQIRKNSELSDVTEFDPATPIERFENHFRYGGNFQESFALGDNDLGYVFGSIYSPKDEVDEWSSSLFDQVLVEIARGTQKPLYQVSHFAPKSSRSAVELMKNLKDSNKDLLIVGTKSIAGLLDRMGWEKVLPDYAASIAQRFQGVELKKYPRVSSISLARVAKKIAKEKLLNRMG